MGVDVGPMLGVETGVNERNTFGAVSARCFAMCSTCGPNGAANIFMYEIV